MNAARAVKKYWLAWDTTAKHGQIEFIVERERAATILSLPADEFCAISLLLGQPNVVWDGVTLRTAPAGHLLASSTLLARSGRFFKEVSSIAPAAQRVIDACEHEWPANRSDCSGFAKDVAGQFGVSLQGRADDIVDAIHGGAWMALSDGRAAKDQADQGKLVIGGLRGDEQEIPSEHGHVVVVVSGPLDRDRYPTAYWGTLGGTGERAETINWAWKAMDRDHVFYAAHDI